MIVTCKKCEVRFGAKSSSNRVFCSLKCKHDFERGFDLNELKRLAAEGHEGKEIAAILKLSQPRVTRAIKTHGLSKAWRTRRYEVGKKGAAVFIVDEGRPMSLRQFSRKYGLCHNTVYSRWARGERNAEKLSRHADQRFARSKKVHSCLSSLLAGWKSVHGASEASAGISQSASTG